MRTNIQNSKYTFIIFKSLFVVILAVFMLIGSRNCIFVMAAEEKTITSYKVGDILEFGWYPQSKVTDSGIIAKLNALGGDNSIWTSYSYYYGTGEAYDGQMTAGDWMRYTDVVYCSNKYRGVIFDSYRPYSTGGALSMTGTNEYGRGISTQKDNGYNAGTVYWFLYEPIKWRVLDPVTGMVMSETILDSQAYNNYILYLNSEYWGEPTKTYYANNYAESSIRQWLNNNFYNIAFSTAQQDIIVYTKLDNSACDEWYSKYGAEDTKDKIYLLSWTEATNENYGFGSVYNTARCAQSSDYAKSQGNEALHANSSNKNNGNSYWCLRSAGYGSSIICGVDAGGLISSEHHSTNSNYIGIRPALNFNPTAAIVQSDVTENGVNNEATDKVPENLSKEYVFGDVNGDGTVSAADARLALRASVGLEKIEEGTSKFLAADVDKDNEITAADARLILRASVGLDTLGI